MLRRRLAAAALAGVMAALFDMPGVASGTQAGEQTVSDYLKVKPGKFKVELREAGEPASSPPVAVFGQLTDVKAALLTDDMSRAANSKSKVRLIQAIPGEAAVDVEIRKAGSNQVLAKANILKLPSGSISSLVAVGGTGAGGTSPSSSPGGWRFALPLVGGGLGAATGFAVQQRRSSG
jgi:hypothetical protein